MVLGKLRTLKFVKSITLQSWTNYTSKPLNRSKGLESPFMRM